MCFESSISLASLLTFSVLSFEAQTKVKTLRTVFFSVIGTWNYENQHHYILLDFKIHPDELSYRK